MKSTVSLLVSFCLVMLACEPEAQQVEAVNNQEAIDALAEQARQFSQAYMDGDVQKLLSIYTDDAVIFPSNSEYIRGMEALEQYWTLPEGRTITHHKLVPVEVVVTGDMASDFGYYEVSGENNGVAWGPSHGKYVVVWKRGEDSVWRMYLDMWNSRAQPAE